MSEEESIVQTTQGILWVLAFVFGICGWIWDSSMATGCMAGCGALIAVGVYIRCLIRTISKNSLAACVKEIGKYD